MKQENINAAIRIADELLANTKTTDLQRSAMEALKSELETGLNTKQFNQDRLRRIVKELFEWVFILKPVLKIILEKWIQDNF